MTETGNAIQVLTKINLVIEPLQKAQAEHINKGNHILFNSEIEFFCRKNMAWATQPSKNANAAPSFL